ncbi:hypothetical protein ABL78_1183 [Leptomonas seymouri]|uniref:Uncharacterized protein n=1 Tax=Leptomonas seymouri TaxID=5684 RepID=A0A0N1I2K2_LEPSE|nr:hypothetical protein ABL78_1183 [Leptomonas seymouri]|eukprot:KPI89690.1 hypothetical protein ABL78_1183 [Leptomonas seymouri]
MLSGRALRHASLLLVFGVLLLIGLLTENAFDSGDGAYADDARELREGGVPLSTLFHTKDYWRRIPLSLDRREYPYVTDAFAKEFLQRTTPPQLVDVRDNRTLMSDDFFEELQLWRRPGSGATKMLQVMRAQIEQERVAARAEAVRQRHSKSWNTRRAPPPSLLSRLLSFLMGGGSGDAAGRGEENVPQFVEVRYASNVLYHGANGTALSGSAKVMEENNGNGLPAGRGGTDAAAGAVRRQAVSLETDEVQLVPYPFIPHASVEVGVGAPPPVKAQTEDIPEEADKGVKQPATLVRIDKGRLRYTVSRRGETHTPTHGWDHFFIALNLWKNEAVIPDLTEALVVFLEDEVKPHCDLATSVVVSIYANVSPDKTAELIESILIPRLHAVGVRTVYATTEGSCLGYVERHPFHERIEWMACIRNSALKPLYEHGMSVFRVVGETQGKDKVADVSSDGLVVLFFNDIFFRPQDITTLLESRAETQMWEEVRPHGWLSSASPSPPTTSPPQQKSRRAPTTRGTTFDMACGMDFYYTFYDTWVTRDRLGHAFEAQMPYSDDHATQDAFYRIFSHDLGQLRGASSMRKGAAPLPRPETFAVPVKCCWNGVAAIRGRFFLPPTQAHRRGFPEAEATPLAQKRKLVVPGSTYNTAGTRPPASEERGKAVPSSPPQRGGPPLVIERPSGAAYELLGDAEVAVNITGIAAYYTRVLTRRLQFERAAWNSTRLAIAELTRHPFYRPAVYANSSSFSALLKDVLEQQVQDELSHSERTAPTTTTTFKWLTLALAFNDSTNSNATSHLFSLIADLQQRKTGRVQFSAAAQPVSEVGTREDSTYYVARYPAVRFRHAFTPSYGATVNGLSPVRDDVCLSSECLLICQDVMQAAILQDQRGPLILLNPHVRVAYDLEHFERVTRHMWFFENPYVYWGWVVARRVQLWWSTGRTSSSGCDNKGAGEGNEASIGALQSAEVRELGEATSATDDWLRSPAAAPAGAHASISPTSGQRSSAYQTLTLEDAFGNFMDVGVTDVSILTQMACQRITAGSIALAVGALFPLFRLGQLLLVALLLRWLCWSTQADITAATSGGSSNGGGGKGLLSRSFASLWWPSSTAVQRSIEERWWASVYNAIWYSSVAWRVRNVVDSLSTDGWTSDSKGGEYEYSSWGSTRRTAAAGEAKEEFLMQNSNGGRGGQSPTAVLPAPLLQQHYRRRKVAITLSTCAYSSRCVLRAVARTTLWLLGAMCCMRFWCGCRTPGPPPVSGCCAKTRCGTLWNGVVADVGGANERRERTRCFGFLAKSGKRGQDEARGGGGGGGWARTAALPTSPTSYANDEQCGAKAHRGSPQNSPGCSATPNSKAGVFRESGDEAGSWGSGSHVCAAQQPQQPMRWQASSWPVHGVAAPSRRSPPMQGYAIEAAASYAANALALSTLAPDVQVYADSPTTAFLLRSDAPYNGGTALQSVRSRNTNVRATTPYTVCTPTSPEFGLFNTGRPEAFSGVEEGGAQRS